MDLNKWGVDLNNSGYEEIHKVENLIIFYNSIDKSKLIINISKKGKVHNVSFLVGSQVIQSFTDKLIKKSKKFERFSSEEFFIMKI